jgi:hypothetical protein
MPTDVSHSDEYAHYLNTIARATGKMVILPTARRCQRVKFYATSLDLLAECIILNYGAAMTANYCDNVTSVGSPAIYVQ